MIVGSSGTSCESVLDLDGSSGWYVGDSSSLGWGAGCWAAAVGWLPFG